MSKKRNNHSNAVSNNSIRVKSHYVSKHSEKLTVEFNGKLVEIRRVWDSKKKELRKELQELSETQDVFRRNLLVIDACLKAVGLQWADAPIKEVGKVEWQEGGETYEGPATRIKFLKNGGQVRLCRKTDGTQAVELDVVTSTTVSQCIADVQAWSDEDQEALSAYNEAVKRRKADRERHERYEKNYVHTFNCDALFSQAGL
jgi:hypothetical protein